MIIQVIFVGKRGMKKGWPHANFDIDKEIKTLKSQLEKLRKKLSTEIKFTGFDLVSTDKELIELSGKIRDADGLLVSYLTTELGSATPDLLFKIADFGVPIILYTQPFSTYWDGSGRFKREKRNVTVVASGNMDDLNEKIKIMNAIAKLKRTKILVFKNRWIPPSYVDRVKRIFGVEIKQIGHKRLEDAYNSVKIDEAEKLAKEVMKNAKKIIEPSKVDIIDAVRLYLAVKDILKEEKANAVTIDCLPGGVVPSDAIPATPCMANSLLNDQGIVAACEADLDTMLTMLIFRYLTDRPSYMSDPVIAADKKEIIFSHCTSPTKMNGFSMTPENYILRSHAESGDKVGLQVKMKVGQTVTIAELMSTARADILGSEAYQEVIASKKFCGYKMIAFESKIEDNLESERGCRTKIGVKTEAPQKFVNNFYGEHRVLAYGSHAKKLEIMSELLNIDLIPKTPNKEVFEAK